MCKIMRLFADRADLGLLSQERWIKSRINVFWWRVNERDDMLLEHFKGWTLKGSDNVIPAGYSAGEKAVFISISTTPNFLKYIWKISTSLLGGSKRCR